MKNGEKSNVKM